jgi:hypothetical protein
MYKSQILIALCLCAALTPTPLLSGGLLPVILLWSMFTLVAVGHLTSRPKSFAYTPIGEGLFDVLLCISVGVALGMVLRPLGSLGGTMLAMIWLLAWLVPSITRQYLPRGLVVLLSVAGLVAAGQWAMYPALAVFEPSVGNWETWAGMAAAGGCTVSLLGRKTKPHGFAVGPPMLVLLVFLLVLLSFGSSWEWGGGQWWARIVTLALPFLGAVWALCCWLERSPSSREPRWVLLGVLAGMSTLLLEPTADHLWWAGMLPLGLGVCMVFYALSRCGGGQGLLWLAAIMTLFSALPSFTHLPGVLPTIVWSVFAVIVFWMSANTVHPHQRRS